MLLCTVPTVFGLVMASVLCQDNDLLKPTFPNVFQTEVEGMFIKSKEVVEMDASLYYDGEHNRAAFEYTMGGDTSRNIYNFDSNEMVSIVGNACEVQDIVDDSVESFFPFTVEGGKKKMAKPEVLLYFDKSKFDAQELHLVPMLVYKANIGIPAYDQKNCELLHFFSKKIELPNCQTDQICQPTLMSVSVKCKDDKGALTVDHSYNFYRFKSEITDESVFMPPPGVYCPIKSVKKFPAFGSYFAFSYDVVDKQLQAQNSFSVQTTHTKVWYSGGFKLVRIDGYDTRGVLVASRVLNIASKNYFTIIPVSSECYLEEMPAIDLGEATMLPKFLFDSDNSTSGNTVYVGKRSINELTFEVWSTSWIERDANALVVEEVYFLKRIQDIGLGDPPKEPDLKISHIDIYTYGINPANDKNELVTLRHITINNYRTSPKDLAAFDVSTCFDHNQKKGFYLKVNGSGIIRESKSYLQAVEGLYEVIVSESKASLMRLTELTGEFDGKELKGMKGFIINNFNGSGFSPSEPNMDQIFSIIKKAADQGKLRALVDMGANEVANLTVLSVSDPSDLDKKTEKTCYSGTSMAAASLVLLALGISFGIAGYYVFLKRRKSTSHKTLLNEVQLISS